MIEIEIAAAHDDPDAPAAERWWRIEERRVWDRARGLDHDLHHFPQLTHRANDRLIGHGDDVFDQAADLREGTLTDRRAQPIRDGVGMLDRHDPPGVQ